jgi:hypothetical protein
VLLWRRKKEIPSLPCCSRNEPFPPGCNNVSPQTIFGLVSLTNSRGARFRVNCVSLDHHYCFNISSFRDFFRWPNKIYNPAKRNKFRNQRYILFSFQPSGNPFNLESYTRPHAGMLLRPTKRVTAPHLKSFSNASNIPRQLFRFYFPSTNNCCVRCWHPLRPQAGWLHMFKLDLSCDYAFVHSIHSARVTHERVQCRNYWVTPPEAEDKPAAAVRDGWHVGLPDTIWLKLVKKHKKTHFDYCYTITKKSFSISRNYSLLF